MFLEYTKSELEKEETFSTIYDGLTKGGLRLLAYFKPIRGNRDFAFAAWIDCGRGLFAFQNYGQSATKANRKNLQWLLDCIFDNCEYFALVDEEEYCSRACAYYDEQIAKRNAEFAGYVEA